LTIESGRDPQPKRSSNPKWESGNSGTKGFLVSPWFSLLEPSELTGPQTRPTPPPSTISLVSSDRKGVHFKPLPTLESRRVSQHGRPGAAHWASKATDDDASNGLIGELEPKSRLRRAPSDPRIPPRFATWSPWRSSPLTKGVARAEKTDSGCLVKRGSDQ